MEDTVLRMADYKGTDIRLFVFASTLLIYNLARIFPMMLDKESALRNNTWYWQNRILLYVLSSISFGIILYTIPWNNFKLILFLGHLGVVSGLYSLPISKYGIKSIRNTPYLKIFLIAYVWASVVVFLPYLDSGEDLLRSDVLLSFVGKLLFIFAITVPFDIRDTTQDQNDKVITIPGKLGTNRSLIIAQIALLLSGTISIIHYSYYWEGEVIAVIICALVIHFSPRFKSDWYFLGVIDGTILLKSWLPVSLYLPFLF